MSRDRAAGPRAGKRSFRPTIDNQLEPRFLLSRLPGQAFITHPSPGFAFKHMNPEFLSPGAPRFPVKFGHNPEATTETAHGGQSVLVGTTAGDHFLISVTQLQLGQGSAIGPVQFQPATVRAYPMSNGRVGIIVDASNDQTQLSINPVPFPQRKGYAHSFAYAETKRNHLLNIGSIIVSSGSIGAVVGFHTADLSGPLNITGPQTVDRIAFDALLPGASITVGGSLNTLDILHAATLDGGPGIVIGQDLNLLNVGETLSLSGGASLLIARDSGLVLQPAKGTGTGSDILAQNIPLVGTTSNIAVPPVAAYIQGDLDVGPGSSLVIGRGLDQTFEILGSVRGSSRITITSVTPPFGQVVVKGTITP